MLIGLAGYRGAGKSTVAGILGNDHDFERHRFAGPLKGMLKALGLSEAEVDGDKKELPCELLGGATPRHAMQTLGTEWGRACISPTIWTDIWRHRVESVLDSGGSVVVDDVRFVNEAKIIRRLGGHIWRVDRSAVTPVLDSGLHASEVQIHQIRADATIRNEGCVTALTPRIAGLVKLFGGLGDDAN